MSSRIFILILYYALDFFLGSFWCSTMKRDMVEDQVLLLSIGNNVVQLPSVFFFLFFFT